MELEQLFFFVRCHLLLYEGVAPEIWLEIFALPGFRRLDGIVVFP